MKFDGRKRKSTQFMKKPTEFYSSKYNRPNNYHLGFRKYYLPKGEETLLWRNISLKNGAFELLNCPWTITQ